MNSPALPLVLTEDLIRERAYHLWLERGRPDGRDQEIWFDAQALLQGAHPPSATGDDGSRSAAPRQTSPPRDRRPGVAQSGAAQRRRARHAPSTQPPATEARRRSSRPPVVL